jgi:hypothetical protein
MSTKRQHPANALLPLGDAVFALCHAQGDLQVDVTRQALASTGLPANRLSGQVRMSVVLSAQVTAPSISGPYGDGYVLGCRLVRARSIQEVKDMMSEPPELEEAVEDLQQKVGGVFAWQATQELHGFLTCTASRVGCHCAGAACAAAPMARCVCGTITLIWLQFKAMPYNHCCHLASVGFDASDVAAWRVAACLCMRPQLAGDEDVVAAATTVATRCAASMVPMQTPANFGTGEGAQLVPVLGTNVQVGCVACGSTCSCVHARHIQ